jgi:hypothetical protein
MDRYHSRNYWVALVPILSIVGLVSCARPSTVVIEQPLGPSPTSATQSNQGWLVVYTDIEKYADPTLQIQFAEPTRLPYTIVNSAGQPIQTVTARDETPEIVALSAGNYVVRGNTLQGGTIEAKVRISNGQTTNVVLDGSWTPDKAATGDSAVYGPDGTFVGWRAASL